MERHAMAMKIKEGQMEKYRRTLGKLWPELTAFLDRNGIRNFSIWNAENLIFLYYECREGMETFLSEAEKEEKERFVSEMCDILTWISTPGKEMRLMYHNFGIIRECKELIRHRVFITKLKDGCEEEYIARHDRLIEQRGEAADPGPDSNFSIWSAGGYIFGYDEIDITMEQEETLNPEDRRLRGKPGSWRLWIELPTIWTG